ncbi:hypothetical protein M752DRAFT_43176 [Aspergillus phoenicis ATCC 13157]|uniref:Uncharacterized protein n=1 Tax=Aspergillus phoenicis ATCC 13157 TaxID=1353007 RepID=A0A370PDY9_ASPPH|nr:hypothetical protein M752DRAFT_43176 [Aspergillus phoenicis ATCC 13157]
MPGALESVQFRPTRCFDFCCTNLSLRLLFLSLLNPIFTSWHRWRHNSFLAFSLFFGIIKRMYFLISIFTGLFIY